MHILPKFFRGRDHFRNPTLKPAVGANNENAGKAGNEGEAKKSLSIRLPIPSPVHSPGYFSPSVMQPTLSLLSVSLLLAALSPLAWSGGTAFAEVVPSPQVICSSRLDGLAKAKCLVEQRNEILRQLGRLSPASSSTSSSSSESSAVVSSASSASSASSSSPVSYLGRSCSRMNGKEKAMCLYEQRKEILRQIATQPPVASVVQVTIQKPVVKKANCTRYRDPAERVKCHAGNRDGTAASSASASSN